MAVYDHVVVGAGIMGSCTAYQLARRGCKVLLLEKFPLPHSRGSSTGQSRGIRRAYPDPVFHALMEESYAEWHRIERESNTQLLLETGLLCFSDRLDDAFVDSIINSFERTPGSQYQVYKGQQFQSKYPYLSMGDQARGCLDPSGGIIMADKAVRAIQSLCSSLGVDIVDGCDVVRVECCPTRVDVTDSLGRLFVASSLILTPGPWANQLLRQLQCPLPLTPMKIPVYYWKQNQFLPHTFIVEKDGAHVWGLPPLEYPGLAKICLHSGPNIDPDRRDEVNTEHIKTLLKGFIQTHFPGVEPEVMVEESCIYTVTPDWNPVLDKVPGHPNVVIGVGFSGQDGGRLEGNTQRLSSRRLLEEGEVPPTGGGTSANYWRREKYQLLEEGQVGQLKNFEMS